MMSDTYKNRVKNLEKHLQGIIACGHNEDCLFCGFKDKKAAEGLGIDPMVISKDSGNERQIIEHELNHD